MTGEATDRSDLQKMQIGEATDLVALKRLAEQATPGPWLNVESGRPEFNNVTFYIEQNPPGEGSFVAEIQCEHDAAFIAAANPATILSLATLIEAQAAEIEEATRLERADG